VLEVAVAAARVDDEVGAVHVGVDQHVVDGRAALGREDAVLDAAGLERQHVAGHHPVGRAGVVRADELDPAHVADVEEADLTPGGVGLGDDAFVLHRHVPAAEVDDAGARAAWTS